MKLNIWHKESSMKKVTKETAKAKVKNSTKTAAKEKPVKKIVPAKKEKKSAPKAKDNTSLNVREIDWSKTTRDLSMIQRELICKKLDYELDFTHKGKTFSCSSLWKPASGAAVIQIACEKAVLDGVKDYDLGTIVVAVAKDKTVTAMPQNTVKRIKQIARQWVRHTTDLKHLPKGLNK
jgi:hypothetical protein